MTFKISILAAALAAALSFGGQPLAAQSKDATKTARKTSAPTPAPTAADIADAKSKGLVWVNLNTGVYHKDGDFYGKTKKGKFMTEDDAKKAGHRAAQEPAAKKKAAKTTK